MKNRIIAVGKLKERYWRDAAAEYQKRLGPYARTEIVEVEDEKTPENAPPAAERQIMEREGRRILAQIPDGAYVIALAINGRALSSEELAGKLGQFLIHGPERVVWVIGGSLGLSEEVLRRADELLSFSRFTFPHQMMRVILLEQIYRSFRIIHHEPYHK